jgi:hypothetical protein
MKHPSYDFDSSNDIMPKRMKLAIHPAITPSTVPIKNPKKY